MRGGGKNMKKSEYERVFYVTIPWRCHPLKVSQFELVHYWLFGPEVGFWAMTEAKNNEKIEVEGCTIRCRRVKIQTPEERMKKLR